MAEGKARAVELLREAERLEQEGEQMAAMDPEEFGDDKIWLLGPPCLEDNWYDVVLPEGPNGYEAALEQGLVLMAIRKANQIVFSERFLGWKGRKRCWICRLAPTWLTL